MLKRKKQKWPKSNSLFLFSFLFFISLNLLAQKTVHLKGIKGQAFISGDISPNQARQSAINNAKINALKAAGIGENISSYQLLFNSQEKNEYSQFFTSDIQSEIQGAVESFDIINQTTIRKSDIELYLEVTIDASVIKYDTKSDTNFDVFVNGIKGVYNNNDKLTFGVKTSKPCYLTIFNISDTEATLMFPNNFEKNNLFNPLNTYQFPIAQVDYILETEKKDKEVNRLIFVFTKTLVPFIKMNDDQLTTSDAIFSWIYNIMPDQRKVEYRSLLIQK
jgi:hypothetical protein